MTSLLVNPRLKPMHGKRIASSLCLYPGQTSAGPRPGFMCNSPEKDWTSYIGESAGKRSERRQVLFDTDARAFR
jgi:hypothetical protein